MATELIASEIGYLSPKSCGSTIGYTLKTRQAFDCDAKIHYDSFYAQMDLTDCNRKISWQFENDPDSLEKITRAIAILTNFKKELVKAQKKYPKRERKNASSNS